MILLTKINANERCRTCLCKLLKDEDSSYDENLVASFPSKIVDIYINKELQDLLTKYLSMQWEVDFSKDKLFPHYLCLKCFKQLQSFETFRNRALENTEKLYRIFSDNCNEPNIAVNDDGLECKFDVEERSSDCLQNNGFNLFLRDSLMETEAIILNDVCSNTDINITVPDPFQSTQKQKYAKKPRGKGAKIKSALISKRKAFAQKTKKCSSFNENESTLCKLEEAMQSINKIEQTTSDENNETFGCQNIDFQNSDNDSSNNEVLNKKSTHSDVEVKKVNIKDNNSSYTANEIGEDMKKRKCADRISKNSIKLEQNSVEAIKMELLCSNSDMSSESEYDAYAESFAKVMKVEKKKRHYILNSGRKKGLANRYKCDQCQHKFGHKLTLEAHVRKVHEGQKKAFKCQLCDKAYSFIGGLSTHIRDVHERKQESFDCSVAGCDKKYSNFITLQRHVRVKHLNMETPHQYVCEQCGATFKQSSNLRYHMKTRHPTEEDLKRKELLPKDRLECEECKKSFHSQYTLKYHKLRVHADEKKFECKICGRRVAKQFMLDSHMLVHSDQKMACKFCGREFVRKYQVEAHIKAVHQKLKPFQCPHCSESFASRKTLRHHIYIHTGEKPYVCDICGQAYRQPTCLKNHRKIHNKPIANNELLVQAANRNFISNFLLNNDQANEKN